MSLKTIIFQGDQHPAIHDAYHIRECVFSNEQGFDKDIDIDDYDKICTHFIIYDGKTAIATARMISKDTVVKVGRVAVLKSHRGLQIGKKIMRDLEEEARRKGFKKIILSAQTPAQGFYTSLGYLSEGAVYLEEGTPHILMTKEI